MRQPRPILRQQQQQGTHDHPPQHAPQYTSARSAYPTFLSFQDTLKLQIGWAWRGLVDASRWDIVVRLVTRDTEIRTNALKSFLLNGISLLSVYVFDLLLHPLAQDQPQQWLHRNVGWFYRVLWLLPVVGASLYLNASWCSLIARRTFTLRHGLSYPYVGATPTTSPNAYIAFLNSLATSAYRAVMIATSVFLSFALGYVPIVGGVAETIFLCWVDAYYCFESIWIARGLSLSRRIRFLEERWMYYFAFGLPSAMICMWGSTLANAALFALIFPSYIIMAMHAHPVPSDPYNPAPQATSPTASTGTAIMHPSPYVPIRLPVFAPVIFLNECIVGALSLCTRQRGGPRPTTLRPDRGTGVSASMEEGEGEGEGLEMRPVRRAPALRQTAPTRRKFD
ncbi:etoposide-induced protein 2.4-domain-containing protein [Gloeopeniophorella convolvens]|nr:etoposide-induced protein 2.4-domain-containing protein [Gloeopeniophorella convolvens]